MSSEGGGGVKAKAAAAAAVVVQIPNGVKKTIQHIKEITGNHSEDEIYAMLRECSMDPNETTQRLLLQDTFHEVKRKRNKKKEHTNREAGDSRWRSGTQGRGSRGGRANFSPRHTSHDAGGGTISNPGRDAGGNQTGEKGVGPSMPTSQEKSEDSINSGVPILGNGSTMVSSGSGRAMHASGVPAGGHVNQHEGTPSASGTNQLDAAVNPLDANKSSNIAFGTGDTLGEPLQNSSNSTLSVSPAPSSAVCFSSLDPVLVPSNDSRVPGTVGTIKREVGSLRNVNEPNGFIAAKKSTQGVGKSQMNESSQPSSASIPGGSSVSRPSSSYSNRSHQITGSEKVGTNKEWKPKQTNPILIQGCSPAGSSDISSIPVQPSLQSLPASSVPDSEAATSKLQKKPEEMHLPQRQHVIIPTHIHVPESERAKLSFGSFDANFGVKSSYASAETSEKCPTPPSETAEGFEDALDGRAVNDQVTLVTVEREAYSDHLGTPSHVPDNLSNKSDGISHQGPDYQESKQEATLAGGDQQSVQTSSSYNVGFVPPKLGSQAAALENSESQDRDVSRLHSFVPFDPTGFYAQFYRSGADIDGRVSPFPLSGVTTKQNGNVTFMPPHALHPAPEAANPAVLSTAGPTPMVTQAAGLLQNSVAVTQQPLPVFRSPAGLHISHYPPHFIPYGQYISPYFVSPPGMHQYISNGALPQQPQAGNIYPALPGAAAAGVKHSLSQYKPGNTGNSAQIGMLSGYGPYGSSPTGFNPGATAVGGNSTANEDLGSTQLKESNIYIPGQQNEGSAVWLAAPGRDISSLPTSSFYSLPPGQHIAFAPPHTGHGTFAGIYHPAQALTAAAVHPLTQQTQAIAGAVDMGGHAASVYQQPQHQKVNWPGNY